MNESAYAHLRRGAISGLVAGLAYGLFSGFVGNRLVAAAEAYEHHAGDGAVPELVTTAGSAVGGALWGLLLGILAFGVAYYVLEPAIPGPEEARSYLLGAAGFVTVSGAPWLVLPPQPPGVEQALPTSTRIAVYVGMVIAGALACGLAGYAYERLRSAERRRSAERLWSAERTRGAVAIVAAPAVLAVAVALAPANPTSGPVPADLAAAFRATVIVGQVGLWGLMAAIHAHLVARKRSTAPSSPGVPAD